MKQEYTLVRSDRKTISIRLDADGTLIVRAPKRTSRSQIEQILEGHAGWIEKHRALLAKERASAIRITPEMRAEGIRRAREIFPVRAAYFADRLGVDFGTITIREQKTRWGSCSSAGNLNFNWKLVLLPPELLDYVVVHELAHRLEMNHSPRFWAIVGSVLPDYKRLRKRLKEEGRRFQSKAL